MQTKSLFSSVKQEHWSVSNSQNTLFLSEEGMITDMLLYQLSEDEKRKVRTVPITDLYRLCEHANASIIKLYRLDDNENPYVDQTIAADNRPSVISTRVVKQIWSRLTGKQIPTSFNDF